MMMVYESLLSISTWDILYSSMMMVDETLLISIHLLISISNKLFIEIIIDESLWISESIWVNYHHSPEIFGFSLGLFQFQRGSPSSRPQHPRWWPTSSPGKISEEYAVKYQEIPLQKTMKITMGNFFTWWYIIWVNYLGKYYEILWKWMCLKMLCTPLYPMVLLIIIPFLNGYFIGKIHPTFSDKPKYDEDC